MNIRYVAQDLDWSAAMKENVERAVVAPLAADLKTANFELSMVLKKGGPYYELWAVLQTFDGHGNEVIRRKGEEFHSLLDEVSSGMRSMVRKSRRATRGWQFLLSFS